MAVRIVRVYLGRLYVASSWTNAPSATLTMHMRLRTLLGANYYA